MALGFAAVDGAGGRDPGGTPMVVEQLPPAARARLVAIAEDVPLIEAGWLLGAGTDLVVARAPDGTLAGVVTKTGVVARIARCEGGGCLVAASLAMTRDVVSRRPGDGLHEVWDRMKARGVKNVPVIDDEARPIGLLNARDVLQVLLHEAEDGEALPRDHVMGLGYR